MKPTVILTRNADGDFEAHTYGDVRVLWLDRNARSDRVIEDTDRVTEAEIEAMIGGESITTLDKMKAETRALQDMATRILARTAGNEH